MPRHRLVSPPLVLAARTPPAEVTNHDSGSLPYKQYIMFGLVVVTTIPNALACAALFRRRRDLDHDRLVNAVESVCLVHMFLVETLGKNLEAYRMKHEWPWVIKLTRATVTAAVVPQVLLFGSGAICLFVIDDFDFEILWLLPCLMLWSQLAFSIVMALFGKTASIAPTRPLKLSIVFYGITAVASSCLAAAGIALHWQLTFVQQYLFLQAALVWTSYRLMTVIHNILPTRAAKDSGRGDAETTAAEANMENDIFRNLDGRPLNPDDKYIEMVGVPRKEERIDQPERPAPIALLSSDNASAMFVMNSSEAILGQGRKERVSTTLSTRLWRALCARPHRRARDRARAPISYYKNEPTENPEANGSIVSLDCSTVEAKYKDDISDTESSDQARMLSVLEKHDSTWASCSPPSSPTSKDTSDYVPSFDALKHQVDLASHTVVSRHVEESDRRLREELLAKRTPKPISIVAVTDVGDGSGARVAQKSPSAAKVNRRQSLTILPVVLESCSDLEDGLEGNEVTEKDITDDLFFQPT